MQEHSATNRQNHQDFFQNYDFVSQYLNLESEQLEFSSHTPFWQNVVTLSHLSLLSKSVQLQKQPTIHESSKKGTSQMKNLPKYIIKLLKRFITKQKQHPNTQKGQYQEIVDRVDKLHKINNQKPNKPEFNMHHLQTLITGQQKVKKEEGEESRTSQYIGVISDSVLSRSLIRKLIQKNLKSHGVLQNKKIFQKLIYLNGLKLYRLRCMNQQTACRMTSK